MSSLTQNRTMEALAQGVAVISLANPQSPQPEGFFIAPEIPIENLYHPQVNKLSLGYTEHFDGGTRYSALYASRLAMHDVRIYKAAGEQPKPVVLMTSPLGTGTDGHNDNVAKDIARQGCDVIFKSVPHYYHAREDALTLTEDANEMHSLLNSLAEEPTINLGKLEEINVYGESQAAMKLLGVVALASSYGREVKDGLSVAPCFIQKANTHNPVKFIRYGTSMMESMANAGRELSVQEMWSLRKTFSMRDVHHHLAVVPVLLSGEAGTFLPHIDREQHLTNQFFGKDRSSRAHRAQKLLQAAFPNMTTLLDEKYGHVDGIVSKETKRLRHAVFSRIAASRLGRAA